MSETGPDASAANELAEELFERSQVVTELDAPQIEAWVSGLFAAFDAPGEAAAFVEFCASKSDATAAGLLAGIAHLADAVEEPELLREARAAFDRMASAALPASAELGRSRPAQAWRVEAPFGTSLLIGFRLTPDAIDHTLLVELGEEQEIVDLALTGPPDDLLDPDVLGDRKVHVVDLEAGEAMHVIAAAWTRSLSAGAEATPGMLANQRLVARRLVDAGLDRPEWFVSDDAAIDRSRGMTPTEIAQADTAALSTLKGALGDVPDVAVDPAWGDVFRGNVSGLSPREREGLLWLEWADWLGATIGLVRSDGAVEVTPELLIDHVNRCPEISSTVHADDREYAAWAFHVALDHLDDAGALPERRLTNEIRQTLHASLAATWAASPAEASEIDSE